MGIAYGLNKYTRPAEKASFAERFKSQAEVEKNGGSISGSVASFPVVRNVKTVIARLSSADTGSNTVKINSGQTITITAGNLFGSYSNATAFDADDIQVDDWEKFDLVLISEDVLTADELTAYENGTMWSYDQDCVMWMDGKMPRYGSQGGYDPTNSRHLDSSGSGNHIAITGATKLSGRGYELDGIDDLLALASRTSRFPYMLIRQSGQVSTSESTSIYDNIKTAGAFTGEVLAVCLFSSELNPTQIRDLYQRLVQDKEV